MRMFLSLLNYPSFLINLLLSIPIVGRLTALLWKGSLDLFWRVIGLPDVLLGLVGFLPVKKMRIAVLVLGGADKDPVIKMDKLKEAIEEAVEIYRNAANAWLKIEQVEFIEKPAPNGALTPSCRVSALREDLATVGSYFELQANTTCFDSSFQRLSGISAPIIIYVVKQIQGGDIGCSLGPFTDYVTIEGRKPICIAHEIAHACGLLHVGNRENLAAHICGGRTLTRWQKAIVRSSRHVSYF